MQKQSTSAYCIKLIELYGTIGIKICLKIVHLILNFIYTMIENRIKG